MIDRSSWLACVIAAVLGVAQAHADAIVTTQAMNASTIAEVFIEDDGLTLDLEIGIGDIGSFAGILRDEPPESRSEAPPSSKTRVEVFCNSDWRILADGQLLIGDLQSIVPGKRVVRDKVTGDPLVPQPDDAESVVRVTLRYQFKERPEELEMELPFASAKVRPSIGFVCYHRELPVNDFRYLPETVNLSLDWEDPWYSRFQHRNLWRQNNAPMSAFLYIEPYEVRREIIIRPRDLQAWVDLGLTEDGMIRVDEQEELKRRVADFLAKRGQVTVDGRTISGRLDRIHFIRRTLRTTGVIEPPVDLDATSATLGVIFVYPIDHLPDQVSMEWDLFNSKIQRIPAVATDEAGGLPHEFSSEDPTLVWKNYLTNPSTPEMAVVERPPVRASYAIPVLSVFFGVGAIILACLQIKHAKSGEGTKSGQGFKPAGVALLIVSLVLAIALLPFAKLRIDDPFEETVPPSEPQANAIATGLLHNVYRSFDHHDETLIYDRLAASISGELLAEVYLETLKSMEVKNQGGLRISVKEVAIISLDPVQATGDAHTFRCRWRVGGWIGHWGHVHRRQNEHTAEVTFAPRDGTWKITALEMLDEQTVEPTDSEQWQPANKATNDD